MNTKILVTYASRSGSTVGIAEAIGKTLAESGAEVTVRAMQDVHDLTPYGAVVAGSAIRDRKWLPEATEFVRKNRTALAAKPFALFAVCMTLAMRNGNQYRDGVAAWLSPVREIVQPVSEGLFAGVLDLQKIESMRARINFRFSIALGIWSEGDHRDWAAIRSWAASLSPKLHAA